MILPGVSAAHRRAELAGNLAAVQERIAAACKASARSRDDVTLIAVTKTYPAADVLHLLSLGVAEIGENRDQEAAPKAAEVAVQAVVQGVAVRWHFVGRLQRNKCRSVVAYADMIHSADSVDLVHELDRQARLRRDQPVEVLVQVSLDGDTGRGGAYGDTVRAVADEVALSAPLRLRGVMAVAPLGWVPEKAYAELARYITLVRADHPDATVISAGMSDDLDVAVAHGATHVRVGSALLGKRPALG